MIIFEELERVSPARWKRASGTNVWQRLHTWEDFVAQYGDLGFRVLDAPMLNGAVAAQEGGRPVRFVRADASEEEDINPIGKDAMYGLVWINTTGRNGLIGGKYRYDIPPMPAMETHQDTRSGWIPLSEFEGGNVTNPHSKGKRKKNR